jgi:hypothetical protein
MNLGALLRARIHAGSQFPGELPENNPSPRDSMGGSECIARDLVSVALQRLFVAPCLASLRCPVLENGHEQRIRCRGWAQVPPSVTASAAVRGGSLVLTGRSKTVDSRYVDRYSTPAWMWLKSTYASARVGQISILLCHQVFPNVETSRQML